MASVTEIPCPNCDKPLKVPDAVFGKKIKCKFCSHPFVAEDPDEKPAKGKPAVKPSKPGAKARKEEPKPEPKKEDPKPEPQPASAYKFQEDDDEEEAGAKPRPLALIDEGPDIPRCPHCAKELDPPDAKVCVHCGFNNQTRTKAESVAVWEPDTNDYINHLLPGVLALVVCILIVVIDVVSYVNMREWMTDSWFQKEEEDMNGVKQLYVKPGAFITFIIAAGIMPLASCGRFAFRRLVRENRPPERLKT
jgi:hypothetical protein